MLIETRLKSNYSLAELENKRELHLKLSFYNLITLTKIYHLSICQQRLKRMKAK
jgi:hypothetical protein